MDAAGLMTWLLIGIILAAVFIVLYFVSTGKLVDLLTNPGGGNILCNFPLLKC